MEREELAKLLSVVERAGISHTWIEAIAGTAVSLAGKIDDEAGRSSISQDVGELSAAVEALASALFESGLEHVADLAR